MTGKKFREGYATGVLYMGIFIFVLFIWVKGIETVRGDPYTTFTFFIPGLIFTLGWLWKGEECSKSIVQRFDLVFKKQKEVGE